MGVIRSHQKPKLIFKMQKNKEYYQQLIDLYINNKCTPQQIQELTNYLQQQNNDPAKTLLKSLHDVFGKEITGEGAMPVDAANRIKQQLLQQIVPVKPLSFYRRTKPYFWAAASIILLAVLSLIYTFFLRSTNTAPAISKNLPSVGNDKQAPRYNHALLTLADGSRISLDSMQDGSVVIQNHVKIIKTANGRIIYELTENAPPLNEAVIPLNTITNPKGSKVIDIILSDGSHVWLNAGSAVTYPVIFNGTERKVNMQGEAYFEVARRQQYTHNNQAGSPFIVTHDNVKIEVLGTHFNINAYDDETNISTTVLEGSVRVSAGNNSVIINNEQQAAVTNATQPIAIQKANVEQVMAWKNGSFYFKKTRLPDVMRQLSRWYNVSIRYEGTPPNIEFGGEIGRDLNLLQVLRLLEKNAVKFSLKDDEIIIKK